MSERLINSAWRLVLISLIFVLGAAAMFQLYQGVLALLGGQWKKRTRAGHLRHRAMGGGGVRLHGKAPWGFS